MVWAFLQNYHAGCLGNVYLFSEGLREMVLTGYFAGMAVGAILVIYQKPIVFVCHFL
jgi:hypothetical protein